jgi:hypothetical protein
MAGMFESSSLLLHPIRADYEWIICATRGGRLLWSDPTACGHPPKYHPGGNPSHRTKSGERVKKRAYKPPKKANPGNVIKLSVGKGHMGPTAGPWGRPAR